MVIPTYNEESLIEKKIENTMNLEYPRDKLELIVIDCSSDKTPEIVGQYQQRYPNIRLIRQEKRTGLSDALNQAYEAAKGEIVIKSDSDSLVLKKEGIVEIVSYFADPKIGGVCGVRVASQKNPKLARSIEHNFRNLQIMLQIAESNLDSTVVAHGSLAAFRKDLIDKIDPKSAADDTELFVKIRKKGFRTIIDPNITTYEPAEENVHRRRKQMDRRTQGIVKVLFQNVDMLFNPKHGKYGFVSFPINFFLLIFSPYLLLLDFVAMVYLFSLSLQLLETIASAFLVSGAITLIYYKRLIPPLAAFLDTQISAFFAGIKLLTKGTEYQWEKTRPSGT